MNKFNVARATSNSHSRKEKLQRVLLIGALMICLSSGKEAMAQKPNLKAIETELGIKVPDQRRPYVESVITKIDEKALLKAKELVAKDIKEINDPKRGAEYFTEAINTIDDAYTGKETAVTA
jgi:hypothetical protein